MKVKVKSADGSSVEGVVEAVLDAADLPEGLFAEADFEPRFNERFARRAKSLEKTALEKALGDEGFRTKALAEWGIDLTKLDGKGGDLTAEKLKQAMEEWRTRELVPVTTQLTAMKAKVDKALTQRLSQAILAAAETVGIRKEFRRPLTEGSEPMIVAALRHQFGYDEEHDEFFEKDPRKDGEFAFSSKPNGTHPYRGIEERLRLFAEDKANADYLDKTKPKGPGLQTPGSRTGADVILTREQAGDLAQIQAAEKLAAEQGGRVIRQQD